jgi:hypothetical protein
MNWEFGEMAIWRNGKTPSNWQWYFPNEDFFLTLFQDGDTEDTQFSSDMTQANQIHNNFNINEWM